SFSLFLSLSFSLSLSLSVSHSLPPCDPPFQFLYSPLSFSLTDPLSPPTLSLSHTHTHTHHHHTTHSSEAHSGPVTGFCLSATLDWVLLTLNCQAGRPQTTALTCST